MSYAVMPLSDYKAACDKVREKVDLTEVKFEETDFGYIRSAVFTAKESGEYVFTVEVKDESKLDIYGIYYAFPEWKGDSSPGNFTVINDKSLSTDFIKGETVRIFISDYNGLKASDIISATLSYNGEVVENFVEPPKIKSGELAEKVDEVYWTAASDFGLKGKGQGELVTLNNVHPIEHKVEVELSSKNLFDYEEFMRRWDNGEYYVNDATNGYIVLDIQLEPNTKYCLKANGTRGGGVVLMSTKEAVNSDIGCAIGVSDTWGAEQAVTTDASGKIYIGAPLAEYVTRELFENALVQVEIGTTPTAYAPFIADFTDCKVYACGKNLFNEAEANITKTEDYFKSNVSYWQSPCLTIPVESGETYKCSCEYYTPNTEIFNTFLAYSISTEKTYTSAAKALVMRLKTQSSTEGYSKASDTFTIPDGIEEVYFIADNEGVGTYFKNFMIEIGTTATEYEPYIGAEYTANADGTVEGVKSISPVMNISTDKAGAVINAECFLDPEAVITDLTNTVITLGGEV